MLSREQLEQLRKEVRLGSVYLSDYENSMGISTENCCNFFEGYLSYLEEILQEDENYSDEKFFELVKDVDTIDNLEGWYFCFEENPLPIKIKNKWNVVEYHYVWKMDDNDEDGGYICDINGISKTDVYIEIEDKDEDVDILVKLVECGYLTPNAVNVTEIGYYSKDCLGLFSKIDLQPLCRLEREVM